MVIDVHENQWGSFPYEDWDENTPGMLSSDWKKAANVKFYVNCDCEPYKRAIKSKDPKWKVGKEKDTFYRLLLCSYFWDYANRKDTIENKQSVIDTTAFKESERISARSIVEMIMLAIEQLD